MIEAQIRLLAISGSWNMFDCIFGHVTLVGMEQVVHRVTGAVADAAAPDRWGEMYFGDGWNRHLS